MFWRNATADEYDLPVHDRRTIDSYDDGLTLHADVAFWADEASHDAGYPPVEIEVFLIQREQRTYMAIVTDGGGQILTANGTYVLPWQEVDGEWQPLPEDPANPYVRAEMTLDMDAELEACIERYVDAHWPEPV